LAQNEKDASSMDPSYPIANPSGPAAQPSQTGSFPRHGAHAANNVSASHEAVDRSAAMPKVDGASHQSTGSFPTTAADISRSIPAIDPSATGSRPAVNPNLSGSFSPSTPAQTSRRAPAKPDSGKAARSVAAPAAALRKAMSRGTNLRAQQAAQRGAQPVIVFDKVLKVYPTQPEKPALNRISLQIFPGEFVFLVGHSGSGKSTFIRLLNRELTVTSGNLYVAGENLATIKSWRVPYLRRNIGCVFQDFKLLPNKTCFENVAFGLEVIGKSKHIVRTQVPEVLRLVGLEDKMNKMPDQLSGGEQQRVSIARAIVNRPPLLICDEPTGNLDPQTSLGIMRLLDRINRTGTIVLVATHDREMVDSMRRRVVALENGILIRDEDRGVYGDHE
jgi:cell division transport system ATP-binding protein